MGIFTSLEIKVEKGDELIIILTFVFVFLLSWFGVGMALGEILKKLAEEKK